MATPPVKDRQQLPDIAKPTADLIERFGYKWALDYEHPLPDLSRRIQLRQEKHNTPRSQVATYKAAMQNGDTFPPIVVTKDGHIVDGNTRIAAARELKGRPFFPAFVIDANYETDARKERIMMLGAAFNTRNGRGIDRAEIMNASREIVNSGQFDATRAAALLGVTSGTMQKIYAEIRGEDRAKSFGITFNGSVSAASKQVLGSRSPKLNDQPFAEIARLLVDAGLKQDELRDLCTKVQEAGSDEEAMKILSRERESREAQITEYRVTGKKQPPASAELRQRLGYILDRSNDPNLMVEKNRNFAQQHLERLENVSSVLTKVIEAQKSFIAEVPS